MGLTQNSARLNFEDGVKLKTVVRLQNGVPNGVRLNLGSDLIWGQTQNRVRLNLGQKVRLQERSKKSRKVM